ncbi:MAG: sugar phosphate isomerase/epimerase [Treponema sp.]|nr:sugar phosphate isomerase/epimerase [Treponema sp.]
MYKALSTGLLGFSGRSLADDIPLAVKYGYGGIIVDIKAVSVTYSPSQLSELLAENKLKAAGFGLPLEFRGDQAVYDEGFKTLKKYFEFAQKAGIARCNTWIRPFSDTLDYRSNFKLHRERLTPVAKLAEEHGICLGLEFVGPETLRKGKAFGFIHNLDGLHELLDAIGTSGIGYLLDVFHWDTAGQVYADFKKIRGNERIAIVHINDAVKGRSLDMQLDQQRELPGATGILRIDEFMKGLEELNYDGPVAVEPFNAALKAMPVEDAVKATMAGINKVWPRN